MPQKRQRRWLLSEAVLDPRIYRTGLVAVALAVIVLAFSLENQPGPLDHDPGAGGVQRGNMPTRR